MCSRTMMRQPRFDDEGRSWRAAPHRELRRRQAIAISSTKRVRLAGLEGKHLRSLSAGHRAACLLGRPRRPCSERISQKYREQPHDCRIVFRDVVRATDRRTMKACLAPPRDLRHRHSAAARSVIEGTEAETAGCSRGAQQPSFDWIVRRRVETTMTFGHPQLAAHSRTSRTRVPTARWPALLCRRALRGLRRARRRRVGATRRGACRARGGDRRARRARLRADAPAARDDLRRLRRGRSTRVVPRACPRPLRRRGGHRVTRPEFIDNRAERTLAEALRTLAADPGYARLRARHRERLLQPRRLPRGRLVVESRPRFRLLLGDRARGAASCSAAGRRRARSGSTRARVSPTSSSSSTPSATGSRSRGGRPSRCCGWRRCCGATRWRCAATCYRFLHGKAYIFRGGVVIAGSANFTYGGLVHNRELALAQYQPNVVEMAERWFDELWAEGEDYRERLIEILTARELQAWTPHDIYLRALLELYGDELELLEDEEGGFTPGQPGGITLTDFQRHGLRRALRVLERFDGVLVGDGVGLGKSFIGTGLLDHYVKREKVHALVVVPAALRDSFWQHYLEQEQIAARVVSYQQLASDAPARRRQGRAPARQGLLPLRPRRRGARVPQPRHRPVPGALAPDGREPQEARADDRDAGEQLDPRPLPPADAVRAAHRSLRAARHPRPQRLLPRGGEGCGARRLGERDVQADRRDQRPPHAPLHPEALPERPDRRQADRVPRGEAEDDALRPGRRLPGALRARRGRDRRQPVARALPARTTSASTASRTGAPRRSPASCAPGCSSGSSRACTPSA